MHAFSDRRSRSDLTHFQCSSRHSPTAAATWLTRAQLNFGSVRDSQQNAMRRSPSRCLPAEISPFCCRCGSSTSPFLSLFLLRRRHSKCSFSVKDSGSPKRKKGRNVEPSAGYLLGPASEAYFTGKTTCALRHSANALIFLKSMGSATLALLRHGQLGAQD